MAICNGEVTELLEFEEWREYSRPELASKFKRMSSARRKAFYGAFLKEASIIARNGRSGGYGV